MKMFFDARSAARNFNKASVNAVKVVDSKANPSVKGSRWAVVSPNRKA